MIEKQHPETLLQYGQPLPSFRRLVILIPNADMDEIRLAQRIRIMMSPKKIDILLLSSVTREEEVSLEHRRLTNLAAILRDPFYTVTSKILSGKHWIEEIKENMLPGDLLVYLEGKYPPIKHSRKQTVGQALASQLSCPVMILNNITIKVVPRPVDNSSNCGMAGSACHYRAFYRI